MWLSYQVPERHSRCSASCVTKLVCAEADAGAQTSVNNTSCDHCTHHMVASSLVHQCVEIAKSSLGVQEREAGRFDESGHYLENANKRDDTDAWLTSAEGAIYHFCFHAFGLDLCPSCWTRDRHFEPRVTCLERVPIASHSL